VILVREIETGFELEDESGDIQRLFDVLDGTRTPGEIAAALEVPPDDIENVLAALDAQGLLEDGAASNGTVDHGRYESNLAYFSAFASLERSAYDLQAALSASSVVVIGAGGFGSWILPSLAGLGIGRVVIVDGDTVAKKNLNRQLLYREPDVGRSKVGVAVEQLRGLNSEIAVEGIERRVGSEEDVAELLDGIDLLICAADEPVELQSWVNAACVAARVPFIGGGWQWTKGVFFAVVPGASACVSCWPSTAELADVALPTRVNRTIAPAAGVAASHMALEALRLLTGCAPSIAAGALWVVDGVTGETKPAFRFDRDPECAVCSGV
jgi:molybdopterin/thiamine biosynthesis adenylyltransferase